MLRDELLNDPLGRGYSSMTDEQAATSLNAPDRTINARVPVREILYFIGNTGKLGDFIDAKSDVNANRRKPVTSVFSLLENPHIEDIDVTVEPFVQGLAAVVSEGLLTQPEADAITAMGTQTVSRAQELGLGNPDEGDVRQARA